MPYCVNCKQNKTSEGRTIEFYTARVAKHRFDIDWQANTRTTTALLDSFQYHAPWLCAECDHELYHALPARLRKRTRLILAILFAVCLAIFLLIAYVADTPTLDSDLDDVAGMLGVPIAILVLPALCITVWVKRSDNDDKIIKEARKTVAGLQRATADARAGTSGESYRPMSVEEYQKLKPPSRDDIDRLNRLF